MLSVKECIFFYHLILATYVKSLFPERKLLNSEFFWGTDSFSSLLPSVTLTLYCKIWYGKSEISCTGKSNSDFKTKSILPHPVPPLSTILKPAEASQQCLWGQVSIKRGEKTIGGAKLESVTLHLTITYY